MYWKLALTAAMIAAGLSIAPLAAQATEDGMDHHPMHHHRMLHSHMSRHHRHGSDGTGYHGRGTATGGPVGGLPNRN